MHEKVRPGNLEFYIFDDVVSRILAIREQRSLAGYSSWGLNDLVTKSWLKAQHSENKDHGIQSHHFMGNRWRNSGNSVRLFFLASKITADGDCSHEIKRHSLEEK